jgi:hypothetical protein
MKLRKSFIDEQPSSRMLLVLPCANQFPGLFATNVSVLEQLSRKGHDRGKIVKQRCSFPKLSAVELNVIVGEEDVFSLCIWHGKLALARRRASIKKKRDLRMLLNAKNTPP